jgi:hypothetical protein
MAEYVLLEIETLEKLIPGIEFHEEAISNSFTGAVSIADASTGERRVTIYLDPGVQDETPGAYAFIGGNTRDGYLVLRNSAGVPTAGIDGKEGDLVVKHILGDVAFRNGDMSIECKIGNDMGRVLHFDADYATLYLGCQGIAGDLIVHNEAHKRTIHLDGQEGDIKLLGADCAEEFEVVDTEDIDPGTVLVIDDGTKLRSCKQPYDKKVAGVVSGANGTGPGILLNSNRSHTKRLPLALNGKVYCRVDAQYSPIEVGDLLTTSSTPGHAMRADDPLRAFGAVIGKALRPLRVGQGLIPIIVALQ